MSRPIIYTTSWCGPCNELKEWITAQGYSVDYRDGDKENQVLKLGTTMVYPLLVYNDGDELIWTRTYTKLVGG